MSLVNPTMRDVRTSVMLLLIGLVVIVGGLASSLLPTWWVLVLVWFHGGMVMITLADYRDILRQREGLLIQDGGGL